MAKRNLKPKPEEPTVPQYAPRGEENEVYEQYLMRKKELRNTRKNVLGLDIDQMMRDWDEDYFNKIAKIPADELDDNQQPLAVNNAFGKVQTALGILVDRNPDFRLDERLEKYSANNQLIRALLKKSWQRTDSLFQLQLFVLNMAKRGWGVGRTFHRKLDMEAKFRKAVNGKEVWEKETITKVDDIAFMNLDNHNVWIDEESRPYDYFSTRDWMWREVWHIDKIRRVFPVAEFPNMKFVEQGGNVQETPDGTSQKNDANAQQQQRREDKEGMTEVYFYENQFDDMFIVEINGVMIIWEPLPQHHKRLSLVTAPWTLRSAETIYGIGVLEAMEKDEQIIDRLLNMNMRQLLLSISPMGFFNGIAGDLDNENFRIKPGKMTQIEGDPKSITFTKVPAPDGKSIEMIRFVEEKEDATTGITKSLEGSIDQIKGQDTAFALGISREAGLKRLKLPLRGLQYAFSWEARNRADLIKQVYSNFEVEHLVSADDVDKYQKEVNENPEFFFQDARGLFMKRFPEENLEIEQNDKGTFEESEEKKFFKIQPEMLSWEGDVWVDVESMLVSSEELEKLDTTRFINLLTPLVTQLPPEISEKWVRQTTLAFNKDPKKWVPDNFLQIMQQAQQQELQGGGIAPPVQAPQTVAEKANTVGGRFKGLFKTQTSSGA